MSFNSCVSFILHSRKHIPEYKSLISSRQMTLKYPNMMKQKMQCQQFHSGEEIYPQVQKEETK